MAEHQLLSNIFHIINDLVKPQNEGKGMMIYRTVEKPVNCLRDLIDGKRLARLLRKNCSNSSKAKQSLTDIVYAYFNTLETPFTTEKIANIIDNWTANQMLNFIVIFMKYMVEFKIYYKSTLERLAHEFECIENYFEDAFDNCVNMINGNEFNPLIDRSFFECESSESNNGIRFTKMLVKSESIGSPVTLTYSYTDLMSEDDTSPDPRVDYDQVIDSVVRTRCSTDEEESQPIQCHIRKKRKLKKLSARFTMKPKRQKNIYRKKRNIEKQITVAELFSNHNIGFESMRESGHNEHQIVSTETLDNNKEIVCSETQTVIIEQKPAFTQTISDTKHSAAICSETQTDTKPHIMSTQTQTAMSAQLRCSETQTENKPEIEISMVRHISDNEISDNEDDCEIIFETSPKSAQKLDTNACKNHLNACIKREPDLLHTQNNASNAMVCVNNSPTNNNDDNNVENNASNSTDLVERSYSKLSESQQNLIENQAYLLGILRNQLNEYERRDRQNNDRIENLENLIKTCEAFFNNNDLDFFDNNNNNDNDIDGNSVN